jgi:hypothetical protein
MAAAQSAKSLFFFIVRLVFIDEYDLLGFYFAKICIYNKLVESVKEISKRWFDAKLWQSDGYVKYWYAVI